MAESHHVPSSYSVSTGPQHIPKGVVCSQVAHLRYGVVLVVWPAESPLADVVAQLAAPGQLGLVLLESGFSFFYWSGLSKRETIVGKGSLLLSKWTIAGRWYEFHQWVVSPNEKDCGIPCLADLCIELCFRFCVIWNRDSVHECAAHLSQFLLHCSWTTSLVLLFPQGEVKPSRLDDCLWGRPHYLVHTSNHTGQTRRQWLLAKCQYSQKKYQAQGDKVQV